jgi:hypothetical protein
MGNTGADMSETLTRLLDGYDLANDEDFSAKDCLRAERNDEQIAVAISYAQARRPARSQPTGALVSSAMLLGDRVLRRDDLRTMPYADFLKTDYWREVRRFVLERSGYRCEVCRRHWPEGSRRAVDVHHMTYEHRGSEYWHQEDLAVLCTKCHEMHHMKLIDANRIITNRRTAR